MKKLFLLPLFSLLSFISLCQPTADFSWTANCHQVNFTDQSTCNGCTITDWHWDFDNGAVSSSQNSTHTYSSSGTYDVSLIVADDGGNMDTISQAVTVTNGPGNMNVIFSGNGPCNQCDGYLDVTVNGGTPPYSYIWSNGGTGVPLIGLCAGSYQITATDANGCIVSADSTLSTEALPIDSIDVSSSGLTCPQTCDGMASVDAVYGGSGPYLYQWTPSGQTTSSVTGLCPGVYEVFVSENLYGNCSISDTVIINSMPQPIATLDSIMHLDCNNDFGYAAVQISGGSGNYSYDWYLDGTSIGVNDTYIDSAQAGSYTFYVSDNTSGCSDSLQISIVDSCGVITGKIFHDLNGNGIYDGEPGIAGVVLEAMPGQYHGVSNDSGDYYILLPDTGLYSVSPYTWPTIYSTCSYFYYGQEGVITFPSDSTFEVQITNTNLISEDHNVGFASQDSGCGWISGFVFNDLNQNGVQDSGESGYGGLNVKIKNSSGQSTYTQTDNSGIYLIEIPIDDSYTISLFNSNISYYCGTAGNLEQSFPTGGQPNLTTITQQSPYSANNDFGVYSSPSLDAQVVNISAYNGINAGQEFTASMDYKIYGSFTGTCTLRLEFDPLIDFISATVNPSAVGNDYAEWVYDGNTTVTPFWNCMGMTFEMDSSAVAGQELVWTGSFSCTQNDICPNNNSLIRNYTVLSGPLKTQSTYLGPISKEVLHTGDQATGNITPNDSTFSYIINFQNITSDTLKHLVIIDKISQHLEISSISMPFSMHPHKFYVPDEETVIWIFDDIAIPDSATNFARSYGFVQYNIRMKPGLSAGTVIENQAWMRLNHGDSIATNMVSNLIVEPDSYPENELQGTDLTVYPNPSGDKVTVETTLDNATIELRDLQGKLLFTGPVPAQRFGLDISSFGSGVYFINVSNGTDVLRQKVVKK